MCWLTWSFQHFVNLFIISHALYCCADLVLHKLHLPHPLSLTVTTINQPIYTTLHDIKLSHTSPCYLATCCNEYQLVWTVHPSHVISTISCDPLHHVISCDLHIQTFIWPLARYSIYSYPFCQALLYVTVRTKNRLVHTSKIDSLEDHNFF